jgi:hypothetical protein
MYDIDDIDDIDLPSRHDFEIVVVVPPIAISSVECDRVPRGRIPRRRRDR